MTPQRTSNLDPAMLEGAVAAVRGRIDRASRASGRGSGDVCILAATKYVDGAATAALAAAGLQDLAENRLDGLMCKRALTSIPIEVRWHFIGRLQSRQASAIAAEVDTIHTLCTASAAARLAAVTARPHVFVQVNIDGDPAKDGLAPGDVERFLTDLPEDLQVAGLMAMPALTVDAGASRPAFSRMRELRDALKPHFAGRHSLDALSMGTSQDFEAAVLEGATHVRLGRILYTQEEGRD